MSSYNKKKYISELANNRREVIIEQYGKRKFKCVPLRVVGNQLNYKLSSSCLVDGFNYAKIRSIDIVDIHRVDNP